ncbi:MAG: hypothetical protein QM608_11950 [Caulobacter sp.]
MDDLIRNLRGRAGALVAIALALGLAAAWPLATGRAPNPALLAMAALLLGLAAVVRFRHR